MLVRAAVVREGGGSFTVEEFTLDPPRPDEVVVEVLAVGLCHTDIAVRERWMEFPLPAVLGHEGAGVVRHVGRSVTAVAPGDLVVMTFWHCGKCTYCRRGHPAYCVEGGVRTTHGARPDGTNALHGDGPVHGFFFSQSSFATHAIATERNVVKLAAGTDPVVAAPLACGVQTGAGTVFNVLRPAVGSAMAVFGVGAVGLAAVMAGRLVGCAQIVAVDLDRDRLALATELGATHALHPSDDDVVGALKQISRGGVDYTIDTTGVPSVAAQAVDGLAKLGTCALLGVGPADTRLPLDMNRLLRSGRIVRGVVEGDSQPAELIPLLSRLHRSGEFPVHRMISTYPLTDINQAVADLRDGAVVKAVLEPWRSAGGAEAGGADKGLS